MDRIEIIYRNGTYSVRLVRNVGARQTFESEQNFQDALSAMICAECLTYEWERNCDNWDNPDPHHLIFVRLVNFPAVHPNQTTLDI